MTAYFPITEPISHDAHSIMAALNSRSKQLKLEIDSQSIPKKITICAIKILTVTSGVLAIASMPVALIMFSAAPLTIGAISASAAICSLAFYMLLDPRSPGELILRDQWRSVFDSLRKGKGKEILETCQELARQKEKKSSSFALCLGSLPQNETTPFFHKTCLIGYLQIALEYLRNGEEEEAISHAHRALSHFGASGFSAEIKDFAQKIVESPKDVRHLMDALHIGEDLHALDYLIVMARPEE